MYFIYIYLFITHIHALYRINFFLLSNFFTGKLEAILHSWSEEYLSIIRYLDFIKENGHLLS